MISRHSFLLFFGSAVVLAFPVPGVLGRSLPQVTTEWEKVIRESKTIITIQVCPEPPMYRGKPTHDPIYKALRDFQPEYARLQPWHPYPKLSVAELEPPQGGKTFWDFSVLDPIVEDFMEATAGHSVVFDFSTLPQWMWKTEKPVPYPDNPEEITWKYTQGSELRDPSMKEVVDYQARLASWYTQGGLKDEYGKWHESGHHFKVAYWEVLNEIDYEHEISPQFYTALYDAIVPAVRRIIPDTKFIGLALADPVGRPEFFQYFLNPKNHKPAIPLDMISYHFYSQTAPDATPEVQQFTIFEEADKFLTAVRYIESIRKELSPKTRTFINEIGSMLPEPQAPKLVAPIPDSYWNLSGAMWAYLYAHLASMGIDMAAGAELIDYPGQFASTTLLDWDTGRPNARYWVLKLLRDNFLPGDKLVETKLESPYVFSQGFVTHDGKRKILLVNKRDRTLEVSIPEGAGARVDTVDQTTGLNPPATTQINSDVLTLRGLAVAVVTMAK
jgi:hypothetical protein